MKTNMGDTVTKGRPRVCLSASRILFDVFLQSPAIQRLFSSFTAIRKLHSRPRPPTSLCDYNNSSDNGDPTKRRKQRDNCHQERA